MKIVEGEIRQEDGLYEQAWIGIVLREKPVIGGLVVDFGSRRGNIGVVGGGQGVEIRATSELLERMKAEAGVRFPGFEIEARVY